MSLSQELSAILFDYTDEIPESTYMSILKELQHIPTDISTISKEVSSQKLEELCSQKKQLKRHITENKHYIRYYTREFQSELKKTTSGISYINKLQKNIHQLKQKKQLRESVDNIFVKIQNTNVCVSELPNKTLKAIIAPIPTHLRKGIKTKQEMLECIVRYKHQLFTTENNQNSIIAEIINIFTEPIWNSVPEETTPIDNTHTSPSELIVPDQTQTSPRDSEILQEIAATDPNLRFVWSELDNVPEETTPIHQTQTSPRDSEILQEIAATDPNLRFVWPELD